MSLEAYLLYLSVLAAFFAAPPDTSQLLIMTHSLRHGLRKSLATVAEDLTANTLQILLAGFGLTIVIAAHAQALSVIIWAGVAYLCWLGLRLFIRKNRAATPVEAAPGRLFRQGFFTSSANPYAVVFFAALFPQFIDAALPIWPQLLILGGTYLVVDGALLILWGLIAQRRLRRIQSLQGRWLNRFSGGLMIAGTALLASKDIESATAQ